MREKACAYKQAFTVITKNLFIFEKKKIQNRFHNHFASLYNFEQNLGNDQFEIEKKSPQFSN